MLMVDRCLSPKPHPDAKCLTLVSYNSSLHVISGFPKLLKLKADEVLAKDTSLVVTWFKGPGYISGRINYGPSLRRSPAEPDPRRSPPPCDGPFHVRAVGLPGLAPSQAPQSAHREDDGEERGHAEREECPDEEETTAAGGPEADPRPSHVDDGDAHQQERREENDDISRSPFGEHERSVQPDDADDHRKEV